MAMYEAKLRTPLPKSLQANQGNEIYLIWKCGKDGNSYEGFYIVSTKLPLCFGLTPTCNQILSSSGSLASVDNVWQIYTYGDNGLHLSVYHKMNLCFGMLTPYTYANNLSRFRYDDVVNYEILGRLGDGENGYTAGTLGSIGTPTNVCN